MNSQPFSGQDKIIKTSNVGGFFLFIGFDFIGKRIDKVL